MSSNYVRGFSWTVTMWVARKKLKELQDQKRLKGAYGNMPSERTGFRLAYGVVDPTGRRQDG